jgi:chromosome segregation ATPase
MKIVVFGLVFFLYFVTFSVSAQQPGRLQSAETSFDYTLTTLRESVDKLTGENQNLAAANAELRGRLQNLADELASLQRDEAKVLDQFEAVDVRYQKKKENLRSLGAPLARLRQESASIDEEFRKLSTEISANEKSDQEISQAIDALEQDIQSLKTGAYPALRGEEALLQQRDQLLRQSNANLASLQQAKQEWTGLQEGTDAGPERVEALRKVRDELAKLLEDKQLFTASLFQQAAKEETILEELKDPGNARGAGIALLEKELGPLNTRSQELGREQEKFQQADLERTSKSNGAVEKEKGQWEAKLAEGNERNKTLRADLDMLRKEMVDLDKKKVKLERALYDQ